MTTKALNGRQARWAELLAEYDFEIEYRTGKTNPADGPSRRPDYRPSDDERATIKLPSLRRQLQEAISRIGAITLRDEGSPPGHWSRAFQTRKLPSPDSDSASARDTPPEGTPPSGLSDGVKSARELTERNANPRRNLVPVAEVTGCKRCISRVAIGVAMATRTAYDLPDEPILDIILKAQRVDAFVLNKTYLVTPHQRKKVAGKLRALEFDWRTDQNGLLRTRNCVFVPASSGLRDAVLQMVHDDPLGAHFGVSKTLALLARSYFWPGMRKSVIDYISTCEICQRTKVKRHRPYGELLSLPQPSGKFRELSMDFITDLPPSLDGAGKVCDSLFVVVCRLTKMAKYIPCLKTINAVELADLFLKEIVLSDWGLPEGIVSDRGAVFTSSFWSAVCWALGMKRKLSTAFHPQTDGQTERQNQTIEHYFRVYCNHLQDDWATKSRPAQFAYNASFHSTIGMSPHEAAYHQALRLPSSVADDFPEGEMPSATKTAGEIVKEQEELGQRWREAAETQAKYYNLHHTKQSLKIGQWVMLSSKNLRQQRPNKKLSDRHLGPFQVLSFRGPMAYELELPNTWNIHPVFHISLLEPYQARPGVDPALRPEAVELDDDEEWEIEEILDDRVRYRKKQYLVRWKGWAPAYDQWLREEALSSAPLLLQEYREKAAGRLQNAKHEKYRRRGRET